MAEDILDQALAHYELAKDGWREINEKAVQDQQFLSDAPYAQWDEREAQARISVNRPVVEIDQLSQFVHQVANDIRQNTPAIKVLPIGDDTDVETAEMISGRIKAIEYKSNADSAYDMAADFAIRSSLGYIRVDHGYVSDKGFEQELKIIRVVNPQAILLDPCSIEPDGSDAKFGFVFDKISVADFKKKYPDATPCSFGEEMERSPQDKDMLTIAEYFHIEENEEEYGLNDDGSSEIVADGKRYKSMRKVKKPKVSRCWLSGKDTLTEPSKFPGKYVPLVPVYGEEAWIEGKRNLYSLIRKAKSSAMMYNSLKSSETEVLLKQQQAPVQAAVGQMRGFEDDWKTPDKAMVLYYHQTDVNGQPAPAPQRLNPPVVSSGYAQASLDAENNIRKTIGMYNAGVGKREGQASGVALKQLEMSGDTASLHFADNLNRSVAQVGKIIVCALPEIEDSPRTVSIITEEDEIKTIGINGKTVEGQKKTYDFTKGEYDVRVVAGPSFTTQRQEAGAMYADLIGKMPDLMPVIGDLVFKYQDNPGAQAISSRLKKLVDPKLLDESERDKEQPDAALVQLQQEAQQVIEAAQQEIQKLTMELEKAKADNSAKQADVQVKGGELQLKAAELKIKQEELVLKREEMAVKADIENKKIQADVVKARISAKSYASADLAMVDPELNEGGVAPIAVVLDQVAQQSQQQVAAMGAMIESLSLAQQQAAQQQAQSTALLAQAITAPKKVVRDKDGNVIGVK